MGYVLVKWDFEPAPLILGMVLGLMVEENLRRALIISRGDTSVFFTSPLSLGLLLLSAALLILAVLPSISGKRNEVFVEED